MVFIKEGPDGQKEKEGHQRRKERALTDCMGNHFSHEHRDWPCSVDGLFRWSWNDK